MLLASRFQVQSDAEQASNAEDSVLSYSSKYFVGHRHLKTGRHSNIDAMLLGGVTDLKECSADVQRQGKLCH